MNGQNGFVQGINKTESRLYGMTCYLCGAMCRVADGGIIWRQQITPILNELGVIVLDPCDKPFYGLPESPNARQQIEEWKQAGEYNKVKDYMRAVRTMDLRCVDKADFLIASIDLDVHLCGSYEEIATANRQKKPILCWVRQGKYATPNWLFGMIPHQHIFSTLDELMGYLYHINTSPEIETYNRWYFPIFEKLYDVNVLGRLIKQHV